MLTPTGVMVAFWTSMVAYDRREQLPQVRHSDLPVDPVLDAFFEAFPLLVVRHGRYGHYDRHSQHRGGCPNHQLDALYHATYYYRRRNPRRVAPAVIHIHNFTRWQLKGRSLVGLRPSKLWT